jgi:hypothetical protein
LATCPLARELSEGHFNDWHTPKTNILPVTMSRENRHIFNKTTYYIDYSYELVLLGVYG